jgi:hypothetical protein
VEAIRLKAGAESQEVHERNEPPWKVLFSLNVAFAVVSALFIYDGAYHQADAPKIVRKCLEAFTRTLVDIAPLGFHGRTKSELLRSEVIREAVFVGLTSLIALFLYSLTRLVTQRKGARRVVFILFGMSAFLAVPASWLYVVSATWSIYFPTSFSLAYGYTSLLEITFAAGLLYILRKEPFWCGATVCVLHYIFWMLLMLPHLFNSLAGLPLSLIVPWSEITWLRLAQDAARRQVSVRGRAETA